ncbi:uncharacterized protein LOC141655966 [Silene latifolia]|uniref:uncharacterized protein LOC141655966 n=1 Tax=Silene latifolia TaxID=37657 RepID=UPI003D77692F
MKQVSLFHEFVKKTTQIILPFSLFSFLILHPSWLPFMQSFISNFSTFYFQIISLAADKNYIFLLCNGILVFVAKYSCQTVDPQPGSLDEKSTSDPLLDQKLTLVDDVVVYNQYKDDYIQIDDQTTSAAAEEEQEQEDDYDYDDKHVLEEEFPYENIQEDINVDIKKEEYIIEEYQNTRALLFEDEEKEEEDAEKEKEQEQDNIIANMSTEDLNRKFDDFIKKMKEEIRFEAQQQLIVV